MRPSLAVVLHDAAPATWAACERLHRCVQQVAPVPVTWLAVPRYHGMRPDSFFEESLDIALARGDELALHGYTHWDAEPTRGWLDHARRRWYTASEGEFAALGQAQAAQRLRAGRRWFERRRWPLHGFVAPAWLLSEGSRSALDAAGFDYTCTLTGLVDLRRRATLPSRAVVYSTRSAWRRSVSTPWNAAVAHRQRAAPLLRFELHPGDAEHRSVRRSWMGLLERALEGRDALTLTQVVARWREDEGAIRANTQGQQTNSTVAVASPAHAPASTSLG
ncbi:polysaccharide deacetylase family protein [Methylibium sp.]|uniref:polysaccharide deacetylase family protein n=1 Tax=Methylibium sp. TaxID=2067992 RepID=UPI00181666FC|nr:polysaccharide deacetylase family protein [Methylibium sp.]MBA3589704.1 DUF2334 domain-containing protein [Methylibium sp.]